MGTEACETACACRGSTVGSQPSIVPGAPPARFPSVPSHPGLPRRAVLE